MDNCRCSDHKYFEAGLASVVPAAWPAIHASPGFPAGAIQDLPGVAFSATDLSGFSRGVPSRGPESSPDHPEASHRSVPSAWHLTSSLNFSLILHVGSQVLARPFPSFYTEQTHHRTRAFRKLTPAALRPVRQPALEKNVASWQPCTRRALMSRTTESPENCPIVTTGLSRGDPPVFSTLKPKQVPLVSTCLDLCTQVHLSMELKRYSAPITAQAPAKVFFYLWLNWMHALMQ